MIERTRQPSAGHIPQKPKKSSSESNESKKISLDAETQNMLDEMDKLKKQVEDELNKTLEMSKMTRKEFDAFFNNKKNFTDEQWKKIQALKEGFGGQFQSLFGKEGSQFVEKTTMKKAEKAKKGKSLGSRKRWIPL